MAAEGPAEAQLRAGLWLLEPLDLGLRLVLNAEDSELAQIPNQEICLFGKASA